MTRSHSYARTGVNATAAPAYEYRIDRHDRRLLLVRRRTAGTPARVSEWQRWGRFSTPRQALYAFILLTHPSEDEGRSMVRP